MLVSLRKRSTYNVQRGSGFANRMAVCARGYASAGALAVRQLWFGPGRAAKYAGKGHIRLAANPMVWMRTGR